jgi:heme/copper-type cytochrome/quinol oxidase subunit 4
MWIGGFIAFAAAIVLTGVGFVNYVSHANLMDMSPLLAWSIAACLTVVSLVMFLGGFGWLEHK